MGQEDDGGELDFTLTNAMLEGMVSGGEGLRLDMIDHDDARECKTVPSTPYNLYWDERNKDNMYPLPARDPRVISATQKREVAFSYPSQVMQTEVSTKVVPVFITAVLNGSVFFRLTLPSKENSEACIMQPLGSLMVPSAPEPLSDNVHVQIVTVLPSIFVSSNLSWHVVIRFSGGSYEDYEVEIGDISKGVSDICKDVDIPFVPTAATLSATHNLLVDKKQLGKDEEGFVEAVKSIFHDPDINPRCGSLQLDVVSDCVKQRAPEVFEGIVNGKKNGSFQEALSDYPDTFLVFRYSDKEIESRQLDDSSARAVRVALTLHEKQGCKAVDTQKQSSQRKTEHELIERMRELLSHRDYDQRELLEKLAADQKFLLYLSP
eukprot:gene22610-34599_t